jgi:2,3-dihydroxybenzoate-AMP ligase
MRVRDWSDAEAPLVPLDRADRYRRLGWWRDEMVDELVLQHCQRRVGEPALTAGGRTLTYGQLSSAVENAAARLSRLGIRPDDAVVVQLPNDLELVVLVIALIRLGAQPILTLPALRQHELDHVLEKTMPVAMAIPRHFRRFDYLALAREMQELHPSIHTLLVAGGGDSEGVDLGGVCEPAGLEPQTESVESMPRSSEPQRIALFLLSSGTTGPPKPIGRGHGGYGYMLRIGSELAGLSRESVYLAVMPATHGFVLGCPGVLGALASGGRVVLSTVDDPRQALELVERERVTHCALVPAVAIQWVAAAREGKHDLSSLQVLQVGGAKLPPVLADEMRQVLGVRPQQVYGMSEGLLNFTRLDDRDEVVRDTQGKPASPGDEICIVDEAGMEVPPGGIGELLTRGPYTVPGYHRDPQANATSFTPEGFYRTGDLVRLHPSGNLIVEGRVKDVVNRAGEKISVEELESVVLQHPTINAAAAVAMPHPVYGEAVCLYAVLHDGTKLQLSEVRRFLESRGLARYKFPERLEVVDRLPLIGVGKVNKVALRSDITRRLAAG